MFKYNLKFKTYLYVFHLYRYLLAISFFIELFFKGLLELFQFFILKNNARSSFDPTV